MTFFVIGWVGFALSLAITFYGFKLYIETRRRSNMLMAIASKEFYENAEKLVDASGELPDVVFEFLEVMNEAAASKTGHKSLLQAIKMKRAQGTNLLEGQLEFDRDIASMREELLEIFNKTVVAWLNFMTHRNVITMLQIGFAVLKLKSASPVVQSEKSASLNMLRNLNGRVC